MRTSVFRGEKPVNFYFSIPKLDLINMQIADTFKEYYLKYTFGFLDSLVKIKQRSQINPFCN